MHALLNIKSALFLEGPAGSGKTTAATGLLTDWIASGTQPDRILALTPQQNLAAPYRQGVNAIERGVMPSILTYGGFIRQMISLFWPLIAEQVFQDQTPREPTFLTSETAQYYLTRFAEPYIQAGAFDSLHLPRARLVAQIIDNMNKAALSGLGIDEAEARLITAWGNRHSSRPIVYKTTSQIARQYRAFCLENALIDFTLQVELFSQFVLGTPIFEAYFEKNIDCLLVDNVEELGAAAHDLIAWAIPRSERALVIYDWDAGYRTFLGADPNNAYRLADYCPEHMVWDDPSSARSAGVQAAIDQVSYLFSAADEQPGIEPTAIEFLTSTFYPQMIQVCVERARRLIHEEGVLPNQIVILAPFLSDSLRFSLQTGFESAHIASVAYRPSRALATEPPVRAVLTLMAVMNPDWEVFLPPVDVANAFNLLIDDLDPIRATLLASIVYRRQLTSFEDINPAMQSRIGPASGQRFEHLRLWLNQVSMRDLPPDHFLSRLFGEVLSQPGYGFHYQFDAARALDDLIRFARRFRQTVYPGGAEDWSMVALEVYQLVTSGLYTSRGGDLWEQRETSEAVLIAPAYTFLTANRPVAYQFWLDAGNSGWSERLEQPLTHPYALRRDYTHDTAWTDEMEQAAEETAMRNLLLGLLRRCNKGVFVGISDISESGYEQRGLLLKICQEMLNLQRGYSDDDAPS